VCGVRKQERYRRRAESLYDCGLYCVYGMVESPRDSVILNCYFLTERVVGGQTAGTISDRSHPRVGQNEQVNNERLYRAREDVRPVMKVSSQCSCG
jgi:hypothetical protein